jgi:hypothetical protein
LLRTSAEDIAPSPAQHQTYANSHSNTYTYFHSDSYANAYYNTWSNTETASDSTPAPNTAAMKKTNLPSSFSLLRSVQKFC